MTNEEIEQLIQQTKAEFLNEEVVKESDLETAQKQSYAKGWNDCNNRWIQTLRAELDESEDKMTNEERIDWLCRLRTDLNNGVIFTPWNKEFTEALNGVLDREPIEDCRKCKKWDECPCGKEGHINGTSIGYSIGECKEYEPNEEENSSLLTADERALFLNKLTHWLKDNFNDIVIGGWQDNDGEIFDLFFIRRR